MNLIALYFSLMPLGKGMNPYGQLQEDRRADWVL